MMTSVLDDWTGTTTKNVAKVWEALSWKTEDEGFTTFATLSDRCMERANEFSFYELNMRRIAAKYVPRLISNVQKEYGIAVCTELKEQAENDTHFISNIITGDES